MLSERKQIYTHNNHVSKNNMRNECGRGKVKRKDNLKFQNVDRKCMVQGKYNQFISVYFHKKNLKCRCEDLKCNCFSEMRF